LPILSTKFLAAICPLLILGYIFGLLIETLSHGWDVNPVFFLLNAIGIAIAIMRVKPKRSH